MPHETKQSCRFPNLILILFFLLSVSSVSMDPYKVLPLAILFFYCLMFSDCTAPLVNSPNLLRFRRFIYLNVFHSWLLTITCELFEICASWSNYCGVNRLSDSVCLLVLCVMQYRPSSAFNSPFWTTNSGAPVWNNNNSLTVGTRGIGPSWNCCIITHLNDFLFAGIVQL